MEVRGPSHGRRTDYLQGVPKVGRPGRNRRLAWRLSLYIHALGGTQSPYTGQPLPTYAKELQQQYQRLREELGPEATRAARIAGRAAIRKHGLAKAVSEFACSVGSAPDNLRGMVDEAKQQDPPKSRQETSNVPGPASEVSHRELSNCRASTRAPCAKACMWAMTPSGEFVSVGVGGSSRSCDRYSVGYRSSNVSAAGYWHGRAILSQNEIPQYTRRRRDANGYDCPRARIRTPPPPVGAPECFTDNEACGLPAMDRSSQ
jgi:hypothetical protein